MILPRPAVVLAAWLATAVIGLGLAVPARAVTPLAAVLAPAAEAAVAGWVPPSGPVFNDPVGPARTRTAIVARVVAAIRHTPTGETIRIAAYSFDRRAVARALTAAHARGVNVQMVLNDNWTSSSTRKLRKLLGRNVNRASFVTICHKSCRGGPGNLHLKVYSFSRTGAASDVVMTGSANLTDRAVSLQYNDLFTIVGNPALQATFIRVFDQLKRDRRVRPRHVEVTTGAYQTDFYRDLSRALAGSSVSTTPSLARITPANDPVEQRIEQVRCTAAPGTGVGGHTVVKVMMYGWHKSRGAWLARSIAGLKRQGCLVHVIVSVGGAKVNRALRGAGVPVRSADWKYLSDGTVDFYSHLKVMMVDGTYAGAGTRTVWTGSENWSPLSFANDEVVLRINSATVYAAYSRQFDRMWNGRATHPLGMHPGRKP